MKKAREILGLPIIIMDTGEEYLDIKGILIHQNQKKILGLVADEGGWFKGAKVIRFKDIHRIGKDAVLIKNKGKIVKSTEFPELESIIEDQYDLFDMEVIDDQGNKLGFIKNIGFDGRNGIIKTLEISDGVFEDVVNGRRTVPITEEISLELERVIIISEYIQGFNKTGGLKKYFSDPGRDKGIK